MILIGMLLFIGNMSVAQESQSSPVNSKCQAFVSSIFEYYGLPLPGTNGFPVYGHFNLENYDQEKPEFTIMTTPIEIQKQTSGLQRSPYKAQERLEFEGKVLESGIYEFTISEIKYPLRHRHIYNEKPVTYTFNFSKDCKFSSYVILKKPTMNSTGFHVDTNAQCEFYAPKRDVLVLTAYELATTASLDYPYEINDPNKHYVVLPYTTYYIELCTLAKNTNNI